MTNYYLHKKYVTILHINLITIREVLEDDYFEKCKPITYYGPYLLDGTVYAELSHHRIEHDTYLIGEECILSSLLMELAHLEICPRDTRATINSVTLLKALKEVQAEKLDRGIPLDAGRAKDSPLLLPIEGGLQPS